MRNSHGAVKYLYWSERRTGRFIVDNDLAAPQITRTITSPSLNWLPTLSRTATSSGGLRPQIANAIEKSLGKIAVNHFNVAGPIRYAKGASNMVFGEFRGHTDKAERQPALMFTAVDYDRQDRESVAVCLYGSMDNFPEYILDAGPGFRDGWTSSSARAVYDFIKSHGTQFDIYTRTSMASEALKIADGQGLTGIFTDEYTSLGNDQPWLRGYTYGESKHSEWLAEIYLDVDLLKTVSGAEDGFRRVLVGAPLWIRTRTVPGVELYATTENPAVLESRKVRAQRQSMSMDETSPRYSRSRYVESATATFAEVEQHQEKAVEQDLAAAGSSVTMPLPVYQALKTWFVMGAADDLVRCILDLPTDNRVLDLGDDFGRVFAWVWADDKVSAMMLLSDYLSTVRCHELAEKIGLPITLDEVLRGLRRALPRGFSDYDQVVTKAQREMQTYFRTDFRAGPNA